MKAFELILESWLRDYDTLVFCGNWRDGGLMELVPKGAAALTTGRYEHPFDGLRELRVGEHHVRLDLRCLGRARYVMDESVCYGYRPSFELRLEPRVAAGADALALGLSVASPYRGARLDERKVERYLQRAADHTRRFPSIVTVERRFPVRAGDPLGDQARITSIMAAIPALSGGLQP